MTEEFKKVLNIKEIRRKIELEEMGSDELLQEFFNGFKQSATNSATNSEYISQLTGFILKQGEQIQSLKELVNDLAITTERITDDLAEEEIYVDKYNPKDDE